MRTNWKRSMMILAACLLVMGGSLPVLAAEAQPVFASPSAAGALHVEGTSLVGAKGQKVQLRGISTHGLAWFPQYVNAECMKQLRQEWGANVFRLALYTDEYGGYCSGGDQTALKQMIREGVKAARQQDMYVIIDWHVLSDRDPNRYLAQAKAFFSEMAGEFAGMDHVLYEICNEPNGGTTWQQIKTYASQVIPVIREKDPDAVIIVGTPNWSQYVDQAAADPLTGYSNIMYTLHFYAATHKDDLRQKMTEAVKAGLPVFVTEFGICGASGSGAIDEAQADRWVAEMDRQGISYVMWSLCNKAESASVLQPSCRKTAGFSQSDLAPAGKWLYRTLTERAAAEKSGSGSDLGSKVWKYGPKYKDLVSKVIRKVASESAGGASPGAKTEETALKAVSSTKGLTVTAALRNGWQEEGKTVRLYDLKVENTSKKALSGWSLTLDLSGSYELRQIWNAKGEIRGNTLVLTPESYNQTVDPGGNAGDIGFIVVER